MNPGQHVRFYPEKQLQPFESTVEGPSLSLGQCRSDLVSTDTVNILVSFCPPKKVHTYKHYHMHAYTSTQAVMHADTHAHAQTHTHKHAHSIE